MHVQMGVSDVRLLMLPPNGATRSRVRSFVRSTCLEITDTRLALACIYLYGPRDRSQSSNCLGDFNFKRMVSSSPSTMLTAVKSLLLAVFVISAHVEASSPRSLGAQGVNLRLLEQAQSARSQSAKFGGLVVQDSNQIPEKDFDFRAEYFRQPLDHFSKDSRRSWHQRFWVNSRHYKPGGGGPVIVLDGGETSGEVSWWDAICDGFFFNITAAG